MKARTCQLLLTRAEQREEQAQRQRAATQTQEQRARGTLEELLRYRQDFETRASDPRITALDNRSRFAQRLEQATRSQSTAVDQAQARNQTALDVLRSAQQGRQRMEHLLQSEQRRTRQRSERAEQKLTDEAAQRNHHRLGAV